MAVESVVAGGREGEKEASWLVLVLMLLDTATGYCYGHGTTYTEVGTFPGVGISTGPGTGTRTCPDGVPVRSTSQGHSLP